MSNDIHKKEECVCCGGSNLELLLDFKEQPLANSYHKEGEILPRYPLGLNLCNNCYHLQLTHIVNPDLMFKDYLYVTGTSKTMRDYLEWFAGFLTTEHPESQRILDIGCNDATLLDILKEDNWDTYGIDPAENLYKDTIKKGHKITCDYFRSGIYNEPFDVIVAQNVFAHGEDPLSFLHACSELMDENSTLYIQTSQAELVRNNEFDSVYHEHISFFNINSMDKLINRIPGLYLNDVIRTSIHGVSYLFKISRRLDTYKAWMAWEVEKFQGLYSKQTYLDYKANVQSIINHFRLAVSLHNDYTIIGYGAAAKGMTFLGATNVTLDYVIDDNPLKQGLYTPAGSTKIMPADFLRTFKETDKILFIPLAWNYFDEIVNRIKQVRNNENDKYLKYFPQVKF